MPKGIEVRGQRSEVRDFLTRAVIIAVIAASGITALTTGMAVCISKLPAVSPVSLSLAFSSWNQIFQFNLAIWFFVFCIVGSLKLLGFWRWLCEH